MVKVSVIVGVACLSAAAVGQAQPWAQCGGAGYTGPTTCVSGWCCKLSNEWYSQCVQDGCGSNPTTTGGATTRTTTTLRTTTTSTRTTTPGTTTRTTTTAQQPTTTSGSGTCSGSTASTTTLQGYGASARGGSGTAVTVTSCAQLTSALSAGGKIIRVSGLLTGCGIPRVPADTSIIGVGSNSGIINGGLYIRQVNNVVIRNLKFSPEPKGDSISIDQSTNVWVDHCEFYSKGLVGGKDDYDGLLDVKERADFITVSYNKFYDHWKGSLVGHSDNNSDDKGYLRITYHHNSFTNVNSRLPSLRFGTAHVFSNCYTDNPTSGVNSRMGANALVEQNHFRNTNLAIVTDLDSDLPGNARSVNNIFENSPIRITQTSSYNPPYSYTVTSACRVCAHVSANAGVGKITV